MTDAEHTLLLTIGAVLETLLRRNPGNEGEIRVLAAALEAANQPPKYTASELGLG